MTACPEIPGWNKTVMTSMPDRLAVPTVKPYDLALTKNDGPAGLHRIVPQAAARIETEGARLIFKNTDLTRIDLSPLYERTEDEYRVPDIRLLDLLYTLTLYRLWSGSMTGENLYLDEHDPDCLEMPVTVRIGALYKAADYAGSRTAGTVEKLERQIRSLQDIIGTFRDGENVTNRPLLSRLAVTRQPTTLTFCSPYMTELIDRVLSASRRERANRYGVPRGHSYAVMLNAVKKSRNAYAVMRGAAGRIEQSGEPPAVIRPSEILAEYNGLYLSVCASGMPDSENEVLRRSFSAGWSMLRENTVIPEKYENIRLPKLSGPGSVPTLKTLESAEYAVTWDSRKKEPEQPGLYTCTADGWGMTAKPRTGRNA